MITPFKNDYALGLTSTLVNGRRVIAHGGGIDGFNTQLAYYPDSQDGGHRAVERQRRRAGRAQPGSWARSCTARP